MSKSKHWGSTAAEKLELWERWKQWESLNASGRTFGKPSSSIYTQLAPHGGICPTPRQHSPQALTLTEREEISRGMAAGGAIMLAGRAKPHGTAPAAPRAVSLRAYAWLRQAIATKLGYSSLYIEARGVLKKELQQPLRSERTIRRYLYSS